MDLFQNIMLIVIAVQFMYTRRIIRTVVKHQAHLYELICEMLEMKTTQDEP